MGVTRRTTYGTSCWRSSQFATLKVVTLPVNFSVSSVIYYWFMILWLNIRASGAIWGWRTRAVLVSHARLSYPKREKESCTMQLYCAAVIGRTTFWPTVMFVVHSLYTKPHYTYHMGRTSCRVVSLRPLVGLVVWVYSANTARQWAFQQYNWLVQLSPDSFSLSG